MNIREAEREYPDLDLYELARQIKGFLMPYSFVESANLYHGANKAKYHIIFKVPTMPEGWNIIQDVPQEPKSNAEKFKDFFKIEKPVEVSKVPQTVAELYGEFYHNVSWPVLFNLHLDEVYHREVGSKPLGPSHHDDRPSEEWEWSVADGNDNILTGFDPITSLGYKGEVKDLGWRDLVQPGKPVVLYRRANTETKRLNQRHRLKVREIAKKAWKKHPDYTIQKLIESDEVNAATDRKVYGEKTLRDWIKDLAPNRRPGRRRTKP